MSRFALTRGRLRRLALGGLTTAAALGTVTGAAEAASLQLDLKCKYPIVGTQPVKLTITGDFPASLPRSGQIRAIPLEVKLDAPDSGILAIQEDPTKRITGSFKLGMTVGSDLLALPEEVPGTFAGDLPLGGILSAYSLGGQAILPARSGGSQSVNFDVLAFSANLKYLDAAGEVILYPRVTKDINGNPMPDSDGDPETVDISCKIDPPTQNTRLASVTGSSVGPVGALVVHRAKDGMQLCWGEAENAASYRVNLSGPTGAQSFTVTDGTCVRFRGLEMNQVYTASVVAVSAGGAQSSSASTSFVLDLTITDQFPPTAPGDLKAVPGSAGVALSWTASTDPSGIDGYDVYVDGTFSKTVSGTSALIAGLTPAIHTFGVRARDTWDNGATSAVVSVNTGPVCDPPPAVQLVPSKPVVVPFQAGDVGETTIHLRWAVAPPAPCGANAPVDSYRIEFSGGSVTVPGNETDKVITGLQDSTEYVFRIFAVNAAGTSSEPLVVPAETTPVPDTNRTATFAVGGTAVLNTLAKGNVPLAGSSTLSYKAADKSVTGDLKLAQASTGVRFAALGFLPLTGKLGFVPTGATTGSLVGGSLSLTAKVRIKVIKMNLFGAIPLVIGNSCQTKSYSTIALKSTGAFSLDTGGTVGGTFAMSDLNGCGILTGLISPLTAGSGNTITLNFTRPPAPTAAQ